MELSVMTNMAPSPNGTYETSSIFNDDKFHIGRGVLVSFWLDREHHLPYKILSAMAAGHTCLPNS